MKQLLILSGKGGTGKTTISSSFIRLANARAFADCDVDAPNLHLVQKDLPDPSCHDHYGMPKAKIDEERCQRCGVCQENCRFEAISEVNGNYHVDPFSCEGCGLCVELCPAGAIAFPPTVSGETRLYQQNDRVFSTAQLKMGSGTSGKLVTEVKKRLNDAVDHSTELAIIDGSPGIGCPVIASISGVDLVLIVAEPSLSGISDMERVFRTVRQFRARAAVCINKYDLNPANTKKIEDFCRWESIPCLGHIPFDEHSVEAINQGLCVVDVPCKAQEAIESLYHKTIALLEARSNADQSAD